MRTRRLLLDAVAIYLATRVFSAILLLIAAAQQGPNPWAENPSYAEFTGLWWDAGWYERIIVDGYPTPVPLDTHSTWAFFPLYPALVRVGQVLTGGSFIVVAPTISLLAGTVAAALLAVLVRDQALTRAVGPQDASRRALGAVLLLGLFPAAPVLQAAYADALALALLVAALLLLARRRYLWTALAVLALGLTRPVALPFVLVVAAHVWCRYRAKDPPTRGQRWQLGGLAAASVVAGFAWPVITALAAGRWDAYLRVQEAWRGGDDVAPVLAWFTFGFGQLGWAGVVIVAAVIALGVLAVVAPPARSLGTELRTWTGGYLAWLVVAVQPHTSTIRQLLLAVGIPVVLAGSARTRIAVLAVVSAAAQVVWVMVLWRLGIAPGWPP